MVDFVSGTVTVFNQTSAPTGWTKINTYDDCALRVVSGTVSNGGSLNFSACLSSRSWTGSVNSSGPYSTGSYTLTAPQIPFHTHDVRREFRNPAYPAADPASGFEQTMGAAPSTPGIMNTPGVAYETSTTNAIGGGLSHSHPITLTSSFTGSSTDFSVNYIDLILASKD